MCERWPRTALEFGAVVVRGAGVVAAFLSLPLPLPQQANRQQMDNLRPPPSAYTPMEEETFDAPARAAGTRVTAGVKQDDDEWGNGMLGDDLLPGM